MELVPRLPAHIAVVAIRRPGFGADLVKPGGYDRMVSDLQAALASADLPVRASDAPWVLSVPGRLLAKVAGGDVRGLVPDRLVQLDGPGIEIGLYPSDIAISGGQKERTRARAVIMSRLLWTSAHVTTSAETQAIEDRLELLANGLWPTPTGSPLPAGASDELASIDRTLLDADLQTDEWDILYRLRLQVERDLLAGTRRGTSGSSPRGGANPVAPPRAALAPPFVNRSGGTSDMPSDSEGAGRVSSPPAAGRTSIAWLVIAIVSLAAFGVVTWLVASRITFWFEQPLLDLAHGWTAYTTLWNFASDAANFPMIGIGIGLVLWLLRAHQRRQAVLVVVLLAAATLGSEGVKQLVARARPIQTAEVGVVYSYPSGHVLEAATILGIIAILVWRSTLPKPFRVAVPVVVTLLVALVGVARVAVAQHYPSDVLGGALAGIGTLSTFVWLTSKDAAPKDTAASI